MTTAEVIITDRNKKLLVMDNYKFGFHKELSCGTKRYKCSKRGCRAYLKITEPSTVIESCLEHNHSRIPPLILVKHASATAKGARTLEKTDEETNGGVEVKGKEKEDEEEEEAEEKEVPDVDVATVTSTTTTITSVQNNSNHTEVGIVDEELPGKGKDKRKKNHSSITSDDVAELSDAPEKKKYLKRFEKPVNIIKRSKKFTDLQTKIRIIRQSEQGLRTSDISKSFDLSWTTVDSILKNKERYLKAANSVAGDVKLLKSRQDIFVQMEEHLMAWIYHEDAGGALINSTGIRRRAKAIFDELKKMDPDCKAEFGASKGWFNRFLGRSGLKSLLRTYPSERLKCPEPLDWGRPLTGEIYSEPIEFPMPGYSEEAGYNSDDSERLIFELPVECVLKGDNPEDDGPSSIPVPVVKEEPDFAISSSSSVSPLPPFNLLPISEREELTLSSLNYLFSYTREIKKILDRDPHRNRAIKAFTSIAAACEPYRYELEALQDRERKDFLSRLIPINLILTRDAGAQTPATTVSAPAFNTTDKIGMLPPPPALLLIKTEANTSLEFTTNTSS